MPQQPDCPRHPTGSQDRSGSGSNSRRRSFGSYSPPQRDGRTPQTAFPSSALRRGESGETYVVFHFNQWIEVNADEGRHYTSLGFTVFAHSGNVVDWANPLPDVSPAGAFKQQEDIVEQAEEKIIDELDAPYRTSKSKFGSRQ
jgi:hypothetical protein